MKTRVTRLALLLLGVAVLAACSTVPKEIRIEPPGNPLLVEVRADVERYIGTETRWGGTIIAVENEAVETRIEIVARDLYRNGRPLAGDRSLGRFLALMPGFVDPAVYAEGRDITITGVIIGSEPGMIGEHEYSWPLVRVHHHLLWPSRADMRRDYPPRYFYHYDPWYPYYYYPYRIAPPVIIHPPRSDRPSALQR